MPTSVLPFGLVILVPGKEEVWGIWEQFFQLFICDILRQIP